VCGRYLTHLRWAEGGVEKEDARLPYPKRVKTLPAVARSTSPHSPISPRTGIDEPVSRLPQSAEICDTWTTCGVEDSEAFWGSSSDGRSDAVTHESVTVTPAGGQKHDVSRVCFSYANSKQSIDSDVVGNTAGRTRDENDDDVESKASLQHTAAETEQDTTNWLVTDRQTCIDDNGHTVVIVSGTADLTDMPHGGTSSADVSGGLKMQASNDNVNDIFNDDVCVDKQSGVYDDGHTTVSTSDTAELMDMRHWGTSSTAASVGGACEMQTFDDNITDISGDDICRRSCAASCIDELEKLPTTRSDCCDGSETDAAHRINSRRFLQRCRGGSVSVDDDTDFDVPLESAADVCIDRRCLDNDSDADTYVRRDTEDSDVDESFLASQPTWQTVMKKDPWPVKECLLLSLEEVFVCLHR